MSVPFIDDRIKHVGISKLREMTADFLRQMGGERLTYILQIDGEPLAVILSYEMFLEIQSAIQSLEH